jgi:hypothetical protein
MKLTPGGKYDFDLFFCERKTQGSNLLIQTSIFFEQNQSIWAKRILLGAGKDRYDIFEIISGDQSCGASKGGDTVAAASTFKLSGPSINPAQELPTGSSFGGIVIDAQKTRIQVDTAAITGLRPGEYTVAYLSGRSGKGGVIHFTVGGSPSVEMPLAKPPGRTFLAPLAVTLETPTTGAEIFYTLDGSAPALNADGTGNPGGSALRYTGPITLSATATIKAVATRPGWLPSDILVETYVYTAPLSIRKAWFADEDGDGRVEAAFVEFSGNLPKPPDRLDFTLKDPAGAGGTASVLAADGGLTIAGGAANRAKASFKTPFPFGVTSMSPGAEAGMAFRQDEIPLLDSPFAVADSAAPVIAAGDILEPDSAQPLKRILIAFSETVRLPAAPGAALAFKRGDREFIADEIRILRVEKTGDRNYAFYVDSTSDYTPIPGDSVAIKPVGGLTDALGNAPVRALFRRLEGPVPKTPPFDLFVTFPNEGARPARGDAAGPSTVSFIPVGKDGTALSGNGPGKCPGCQAGSNGNFSGPVFHLQIPGPTRYEFRIFSNLGALAAHGIGRIEAEDLASLEKATGLEGLKYRARIVWTGLTDAGGHAGTGAYILTALLRSDKDERTGAEPRSDTRKIVFGLLRNRK